MKNKLGWLFDFFLNLCLVIDSEFMKKKIFYRMWNIKGYKIFLKIFLYFLLF